MEIDPSEVCRLGDRLAMAGVAMSEASRVIGGLRFGPTVAGEYHDVAGGLQAAITRFAGICTKGADTADGHGVVLRAVARAYEAEDKTTSTTLEGVTGDE